MKKSFSMKKLYYSISEVSKITELEQYVLRYWETEFEQLKPAKNLAGNRIYTNKDIKLILYIKKLLREEKYTIEGAKKLLKNYTAKEQESDSEKKSLASSKPENYKSELSLFNPEEGENEESLKKENKLLKKDLQEIKSLLSDLLNGL
ncbi:MAG: MerR family transcriptional regulator [Ignavibacteriae bacterium]|nr:MerR family transcriptional regulator [Ignavibacteriota bacterium]MCB9243300.1 MerR family transcriptional regulator [Ignavibacteriales bacterium]